MTKNGLQRAIMVLAATLAVACNAIPFWRSFDIPGSKLVVSFPRNPREINSLWDNDVDPKLQKGWGCDFNGDAFVTAFVYTTLEYPKSDAEMKELAEKHCKLLGEKAKNMSCCITNGYPSVNFQTEAKADGLYCMFRMTFTPDGMCLQIYSSSKTVPNASIIKHFFNSLHYDKSPLKKRVT
jgi:hypothetical protein